MVDVVVLVNSFTVFFVLGATACDQIYLNLPHLAGRSALQAEFFKLNLHVALVGGLLQIVDFVCWSDVAAGAARCVVRPLVEAGHFGGDRAGTGSQKCDDEDQGQNFPAFFEAASDLCCVQAEKGVVKQGV